LAETYCITSCHILIPNSHCDIFSSAGDFESEFISENRCFTTLMMDLWLMFLLLVDQGDIWTHLAKHFSVMSKLSLQKLKFKKTFSCLLHIYILLI
jgi:hypothetical protein